MTTEILKVVLIPVVAGTVWLVGISWWFVSVVVEGYGQVNRLIRTAKAG